MELDIYQVDAFADQIFKGNPAMVVPLKKWLPDNVMQEIAAENNLSETAFYVPEENGFYIRWFTPTTEVNLCGHATLATSKIIFLRNEVSGDRIKFNCRSGLLTIEKSGDLITMDFPVTYSDEVEKPNWIKHVGGKPKSVFSCGDDLLLVYNSESEILELSPNFNELAKTKTRGVICTAKGEEFDFVSRFFAPAAGINEDPVTGSAHTKLMPYWVKELGKNSLVAKQVSNRGGVLHCTLERDRVKISGKGKLFLKGVIFI